MEEVSESLLEDSQQRFDSIALDVQASEQFRNPESLSLHICIESFHIIEERVRKHVNYKITGEENNSKFAVQRRYKEFTVFQKVLCQTWPGCVVPKLPPKKAMGNLKTSFIDKRKKLLEIFLLKIASTNYFCNSHAFKTFIHNEQNFTKTEKEIKIPTLPEIATVYQELFAEYTYFQPSLQQKAELRDYLIEFQEIHGILKKVKKVARSSSFAFAKYEESIAGLMNGLKTITPLVLQNRNLNIVPKENYVNPYLNIREWLRADLLDIEAMIEGITGCISLEENIKNIEVKIEKKKKHLEGLQSGKKTISQRLFSKTQESVVGEEEKDIEELDATKDALEKILAICIGKMLQSDIPKFKQQKVYKICVTMRNYSLSTVQEYQEIAEQILQIEESLSN